MQRNKFAPLAGLGADVCILLAVYLISGAPLFFREFAAAGAAAMSILSLALIVLACILRGIDRAGVLQGGALLAPLVIFMTAACLWAPVPGQAFLKLFSITVVVASAVVLCASSAMVRLPACLSIFGLLVCLLSLLYLFAFPELATSRNGGIILPYSVKGVFSHKNSFGVVAGVCAFAAYWAFRATKSIAHLVSLLICGVCILLSGAATAIAALCAAILVYEVRALAKPVLVLAAILGLALPWLLFQLDFSSLLSALNRDSSLSGRDLLWQYVTARIWEAPLLGHGLSGLYAQSEWHSVSAAIGMMNLPHAHNVWLEGGYMIGFVGLGLFAYVVVVAPVTARRSSCKIHAFCFSTAVFFMLYGISEVSFFKATLASMLFIAAVLSIVVRRGGCEAA